MYPLTKDVPKPLLKIYGKPVLDYLLDQLMKFRGLESIHIVVNDKFIYKFVDWSVTWQNRVNEKGMDLILYNNGVWDNESRLGAVGDLFLCSIKENYLVNML
jgi:glucose-1-phosphate thymidylyltransferase